MIAVWVQPAALSAVFRTQTAIMGRTAEGAGRIRSARRLAPSSDEDGASDPGDDQAMATPRRRLMSPMA